MDTKLILREVFPEDYARLATLASRLWHAAYDDIPEIGSAQVGYMLEKFRAFPRLQNRYPLTAIPIILWNAAARSRGIRA